jgi:hypothetical protein
MPFYSSVRSSFGPLGKIKYFPKPDIHKPGLILNLDATDPSSYGGSGNVWYDISGNALQATSVDNPVWNNGGWWEFSNAVSPQHFIVNNNLMGQIGIGDVSYTLEAWVWASSLPSTGPFTSGWNVIGHNSGGGIGMQLVNISSAVGLNAGGRSTSNYNSTTTWPIETWAHVVFSREGPSISQGIYINGVFSNSQIGGDTNFTVIDPGSGNLQIGYAANRVTGSFNGRIAYVSLYNQALNATQIAQNFNALRGRFGL